MFRTLPVVAGATLVIGLLASTAADAQTASRRAPSAASSSPAPSINGAPSNLEATWGDGARVVHQAVTALNAADKTMTEAARRGVDAMGRWSTASANAQRASEEFHRLAQAAPATTDAAEAQRWAAIVQQAANVWQGFQVQEMEAARDLNTAIQQNATAQKAMDTALAQLDQGRKMIGEPQPVNASPAGGQGQAASQSQIPAQTQSPTPAPSRARPR